MSNIPTVKVFENITPTNSGTGQEVLEYDHLPSAVQEYSLSHADRSARAWESEPGSLEELRSAKQLAMEYLLRTALRDVEAKTTESHDLWADRFTRASIELYGQPEESEVNKLVSAEIEQWHLLEGSDNVSPPMLHFLQDSYEKIFGPDVRAVPEADRSEELKREKLAVEALGEYLREEFGGMFDLVDKADKQAFEANDLKTLFEEAIKWLAENKDPDWDGWDTVFKDGTGVATGGQERKVKIGRHHVAIKPSGAKELLAHELLAHGIRTENAFRSADEMLMTGIPGFVDAEEGFGKLNEQAIGGISEEPGRDRYIDIAIALREVDGIQLTRQELFQIHFARSLVKLQSRGEFDESELPEIMKKAWGSVDRIYRGGPGDDEGSKQAVYTKDIAYYEGYKKMARYLSEQLASGKSIAEIFDYITLGSFDPTNPRDNARVAKAQRKT